MALTPAEVTHFYESILFRTPNPAELAEGEGRTAEALTDSLIAESAVDVQPFILIYQAAFNRIPDEAGLDFWVNTYRASDLNLWDFTAKIVDTPEFNEGIDARPLPAAINAIYLNALGRNAEPAGLQGWLALINSGEKTLTDVLFDISQSPEARARNIPAVENLQAQVAAGDAEFDGSAPVTDWTPDAPPVEPADHFLTTSPTDRVALAAGDSVSGDASGNQFTDTYNGTDQITGVAGSGNEFFLGVNDKATTSAKVTNVDTISVEHTGGAATEIVVKNWTGVKDLNLTKIQNDFRVTDIQDGATTVNLTDVVWRQDGTDVTLDYDTNETTNEANISVNEVRGNIYVVKGDQQQGTVETINLEIKDRDTAGSESVLGDLLGVGTKTLTIKGGNAGQAFVIQNALNATLTSLDASAAAANLSLNISDSARETINVKLGSGNDTLKTGNTLKTAVEGSDTFDGGAGRDTLEAVFTSGGQRAPKSTNIEVFDLTFNGNAVLDFAQVDNVDTVKIQKSSDPFRLWNLDSTVKTIEVNGDQANSTHHVRYGSAFRDSDLTVKWTNKETDSAAGTLQFENVGKLNFVKNGEGGVNFVGLGTRYASDAWQFDINNQTHPALTSLTVENIGKGDLKLLKNAADQRSLQGSIWDGLGDIGGTNAVTNLTFKTSNTGDIGVRNVRNVASLTDLVVDAANGGDINIKTIGWHYGNQGTLDPANNEGRYDPALLLNTVNLTAKNNSDVNVWLINGLTHPGTDVINDGVGGVRDANGATISQFNVKAESDSRVYLDHLFAGDVENTTVVIENSAAVAFNYWTLWNSRNEGSSTGTFTVSGQGVFEEVGNHGQGTGNWFDFTDQAVKKLDFSGLKNDAVHVDFSNADAAVTFLGTSSTDKGPTGFVGELDANFNGGGVDVGNNNFDNNTYGIGNVSNVDNVYRGQGNNTVAYQINLGQATGDWVIGGKGDDAIYLNGGNDFAYGGAGHNQIYAGSGTNYIVTGRVGANDIWAGTGQDFIFLNSTKASADNAAAPNFVNDFTKGQDKLIVDISDVEASSNSNLIWTDNTDLNSPFNAYRAGNFITLNDATNVSDFEANVIAVNRTGGFQDHGDLLAAIQANGDFEISTDGGNNDRFDVNDALTVAWHDVAGDLHISLAKVTQRLGDSQQTNGDHTYNFELHEVVKLVGESSWINWQQDLLFTA